MKCNNCSYESQDDFAFCPECGAAQSYVPQNQPANLNGSSNAQTQQAGAASNTMAGYILTTLKDSLFLVICILYSVSTAFTLFSLSSLPVIQILITIFLWLTYAQAQKGITSREHLRCVSGTIFASYIVNYVSAGLCAFFGLLIMIFGGMSSGLMSTIMEYALDEAGLSAGMFGGLLSAFAVAFGILLIIIGAGIAVINYFSTRSIHLFVKSVYQSIGAEKAYLAKVNAARIWLMVLGVLGGVSAVFSLFGGEIITFVASGSGAAAEIIGSIMIKKYYNVNNA